MTEHRSAAGRRVFVVEDEMLVALTIEDALNDLGAEIVGPVSQLDVALNMATNTGFDAAILDVNIRGGTTYTVADILAARDIPFVFCSGYGEWAIEERHRGRPRLSKPYSSQDLEDQVLALLDLRPER